MFALSVFQRLGIVAILLSALSVSAYSQLGTRKISVKIPPAPASTPPADSATDSKSPTKKNGRPNERPQQTVETLPVADKGNEANEADSAYYYEFSQPDFVVRKVIIEHDGSGAGNISFEKRGYGEMIKDPVQISAAALERINNAYAALNFLDSNDNYQFEKDYSHLGNTTYRLKRGGRERTAKFNWTENPDAKMLADEYRKIGNQYIWVFDITLAREMQPLNAPSLLDSLDSLIKRNEISDPAQMLPLLKGLVDDERIPLIARNHAGRLVKQIEKVKK